MGKNSTIEWTHHTFNPWWGCFKVSQACKHCYAETWARRMGKDVWGKRAPRRFFGEHHWRDPLTWNADAEAEGQRRRVFCASMADVFEDRRDLDPWRAKLWDLIVATPWLDWLLLTKRPQCVGDMVPWTTDWPRNIWLGVTAENQPCADLRIPILTSYPVACRFLSCEPLLGKIDLSPWLPKSVAAQAKARSATVRKDTFVDWVITGGESGHGARPMNPDWPRNIRDQCGRSGVAFHFKQWGHWCPVASGNMAALRQLIIESESGEKITMAMLGKKHTGRRLDGRVWSEFPELTLVA